MSNNWKNCLLVLVTYPLRSDFSCLKYVAVTLWSCLWFKACLYGNYASVVLVRDHSFPHKIFWTLCINCSAWNETFCPDIHVNKFSGVVWQISVEENLDQLIRICVPCFSFSQWNLFSWSFSAGLTSGVRRVNCYHYLPMQISFLPS